MVGGGPVVPGEQHHLHAQRLHLLDGGAAGGLDHIRHADDARRVTRQPEEQRRDAVGLHAVGGHGQVVRDVAAFLHEGSVAAPQFFPGQFAPQTLAGHCLKVRQVGISNFFFLGLFQDGSGQRMFAAQLQPGGHAQQEFGRHLAGAHHLHHGGFAGGDGAGLVQQKGVGVAGGLQTGGGLEQDAVFGAHAAAHHDGHRGSEAQCAGAADDQHRNAACHRKGQPHAQRQPHRKGDGGDAHDGGHEHGGHPVGGFGQRGLGGGGVPHQPDDLGEGGVLPHAGGAAGERAVLVDGGGADGGAGELVHRHALAGEGGLIHRGHALRHGAVHRDALAGAHQKQVAHFYLSHRHLHLFPVPQQAGGLGGQVHQAFQRVGGAPLGAGLQQLAHRDEGQDHGGGFKIQIVAVLHHQRLIASGQPRADHADGEQPVHQRRARAQRHQRVHAGCAGAQALPAGNKKVPVDEAHRQGQRQLGQPVPQRARAVALQKGGQRQARHVSHRQVHQRNEKAQAGNQAFFQAGGLGVGQCGLQTGVRIGAVARSLHGGADSGLHVAARIGGVVHLHGIGEQAHRDLRHAGHGGHRLLHVSGAGRAGHPGDRVMLHGNLLVANGYVRPYH